MDIDYIAYKSRNKKCSKKFNTGHTYRVYRFGEERLLNRFGQFEEDLPGLEPNGYLLEHGLTSFEKIDEHKTSLNSRKTYGKYSLNKRKRWMLPDLLKEVFKTEVKYDEKAESPDKHHQILREDSKNKGIMVTCNSTVMGKQCFELFDNHGIHINGDFLNHNSIISQFDLHPTNDDSMNMTARSKKRPVFKRGNRRLNRTNASKKKQPVAQIKHDPFYDEIQHKFTFIYSTKRLSGAKCAKPKHVRIMNYQDTRYMPGRPSWVLNEFKYFKFGNYFMNKIIKEAVESVPEYQSFDFVDPEPLDLSYRVNLVDLIGQKVVNLPQRLVRREEIDSEPRKIIYIDEEEIICHELALKKLIVDKSNETVIPEPTNHLVGPVSHVISVFERYELQLEDPTYFSNSVALFVNSNSTSSIICYDVSPAKLYVNLCSFNQHLTQLAASQQLCARLVYDLPFSNQVLLNIDYSNPNQTLKRQDFLAHLITNSTTLTFNSLVQSISNNLYNILCNEVARSRPVSHHSSYSDSVDQSKLLRQFELKLKNLAPIRSTRSDTSIKSIETCEICYNELSHPNEFFNLMSCGHSACLECWRSYLLNKITSMKVSTSVGKDDDAGGRVKVITCLHDSCDEPIRLDLFYSLIEIDYIRKYVQYFTDLQIIRNSDKYIYCKGGKCGRIINVDGNREIKKSSAPVKWYDQLVRRCECGYQVCRFCRGQVHYPALCKQAKMYMEDMKKLEDVGVGSVDELYVSEGKNCPRCESYMEKNAGCNHMSCPCGFNFCWLCLKDFYLYHSASNGYYCKFNQVNETVYDSSTFVSFSTKLKFLKHSLSDIMYKQHMFRVNVNAQGKINNALITLTRSSCITVRKCLSKERSNDLKIIHHLGLNAQTGLSELEERLGVYFLTEIHDNFKWINLVIEYLALLLSCPSKVFKLSTFSYSYKSNLYHSLKKALFLKEKMHELLISGNQGSSQAFKIAHLNRVVFFNTQIDIFLTNIHHLTMKCLRLYEKFDPNQSDLLQIA